MTCEKFIISFHSPEDHEVEVVPVFHVVNHAVRANVRGRAAPERPDLVVEGRAQVVGRGGDERGGDDPAEAVGRGRAPVARVEDHELRRAMHDGRVARRRLVCSG